MSTPTRPRRAYAKTQQVRADIARAALDLVLERGHADVTTTDIAERAGMQKTAAFYHFPTKDHMLLAALEEHARRTFESEEAQSLADVVEQSRRGVLRHHVVRLHQAMSAESHNPAHPAHVFFAHYNRQAINKHADEIRMWQRQGRVSASVDPEMASRLIMTAWGGLQTHWLNEPSFDIGATLSELITTLLGFSPVRGDGGGLLEGDSRG